MLARNLRRGDRNPKPGAVFAGCPRPKALRFGSPFTGGGSLFGDGSYSGNIVQGGLVLQPQPYMLAGELIPNCIVITGAATVAPDPETGAAVFMAASVVILDGGSLTASTNCKGLLGVVQGRVILLNGARYHMDYKGKAGNFGDLTVYNLLPLALRSKLNRTKLAKYMVNGEGAAGAAAPSGTVAGNTGAAAATMCSGGGGSAASHTSWGAAGAGGKGGPCCGGAGGGCGSTSLTAGSPGGPYGGPGGNGGIRVEDADGGAGGAGDPVGVAGYGSGTSVPFNGEGAGGGLLMLFTPMLSIGSGCVVSAKGAAGGNGNWVGAGGAGGGIIVIATLAGGYSNSGTVTAPGGAGGTQQNSGTIGGSGGVGSVNIFQAA